MNLQNTFDANASTSQRDEFVWRMAKKRASFQSHLIVYTIVNTILWGVWAFSIIEHPSALRHVWPLSVMVWWGLSLAIHGLAAYGVGFFDEKRAAEREYEKMMKNRS